MRRTNRSILYLISLLAFVPYVTHAQVPTGTPPFGSFGGGPDVINLANLNSHIVVPVIHKAGRGGFNFTYDLSYDTSIWYPVGSSGNQSWQPVNNWGWRGITEVVTGYLSETVTSTVCSYTNLNGDLYPNGWYTTVSNEVYHDYLGVPHAFAGSTWTRYSTCPGGSGSGGLIGPTSIDGFYTLVSNNSGVVNRYGKFIAAPMNTTSGSANATDRNGNQISIDNNGNFTDTLGTTALTVAGTAPTTFTYTAPSGGSAAYKMNYTQYTVKTYFNAGIAEYGPTSVALVSSIVLPDNSQYTFNYEATPSAASCTPLSGTTSCVTGRITNVTLPTGGQITYSYSGGNNGIFSDGSAATLTRTTPDGTWTYAQVKGSGAASTTTVTDPQGNQTVIQFQGIYETQRVVNQGSATVLLTTNTCYNGATSPCTSTGITLPIAQRGISTQLGASGPTAKTAFTYNSSGLMTEEDDYDFPSGTSLLKKTLITFASLGNNINAFQQQVTVQNGSGTTVAQTTNNYDETTPTPTSGTPQHVAVSGSRGNLTSVSQWVNTTNPNLISHMAYYDTGTINTATDINGAVTTFSYAGTSCGNSFPTGVNEPLGLTRSMAWSCTGGVQTSSTDENNQTTSTTWNDAYFWRPNAATDQTGNQTSFSYQPNPTYCCPPMVASHLNFNNGNSVVYDLQYKDGLGRTYVNQKVQFPSSPMLDTVSYTFDANGRPYSVSMPCAAAVTQPCSTPKTTQTYDALNRPLQTNDGGGGTVTYSYSGIDVFMTVGPAPSGENTKRRQLEYDALGRLTSVCEITNASGSGACGQTSPQTGFWTKYTYDALNNLTGVTQNAQGSPTQTRSYGWDGLSRLTSETNPESGTRNYFWDSTSDFCGNGAFTSTGDLVKTTDAAGNCVLFISDQLHRVIRVGNNHQTTSFCKSFLYDNTNGVLGSKPSGVAVSNPMGRLVEAETDLCTAWPPTPATMVTDEWFSYTARGEVSDVWESTPHSGGYYHVAQSYWANGVPNTLTSNISGLPTFTYGVDGEGRPYQVSASSGQNPVTNTAFNPASLPTAVTYGSGDSDSFSYDPNTSRMTQYKFTVNTSSLTGVLGWNANGTLQTQNITDPFNTADTQNCSYGYDDLTRISSANCGTAAAQTFSYNGDGSGAFGNLSKSGSPYSFQPAYSSATNRMTSIGSFTPSYDANGNVLNDGLHSYTWDAYGRPLTIDSVGITYDALGRPVEQNQSGAYKRSIVYAPTGEKLALVVGQGTVQWGYIPLTGGGTAIYTNGALGWYRHPDWLGSARLTSTPSRTFFGSGAFAPFGESYAWAGATDQPFTGKNQDTVSGLYDFPAREYSIQGRWPSPDPAGLAAVDPTNPQSWNRYAYVLNDPIDLIDPLGLFYLTCQLLGTCGNPENGGGIFFFAVGSLGRLCPHLLYDGGCSIGSPNGGDDNGTGRSHRNTSGSNASTSNTPKQGCVVPTTLQKIGITLQKAVAKLTGSTFGVGAGATLAGGNRLGVTLAVSRQVVVSPSGQAAFVTTVTPISPIAVNSYVSPGVSGYGGFQISFSNAPNPQDLNGPALDFGYGGGEGWGGGGDLSVGWSDNGPVVQGTLTFPVGGGAPAATGHGLAPIATLVTPICP